MHATQAYKFALRTVLCVVFYIDMLNCWQ